MASEPCFCPSSALPFVTEFHYDDSLGGVNEFIEIAVPCNIDLTTDDVQLLVIDSQFEEPDLYVAPVALFEQGDTQGGFTLYSAFIGGSVLNGLPNGFLGIVTYHAYCSSLDYSTFWQIC